MNIYERYKDSGIPWLGEVPEHWEIVPIRYLFQFKNNLRIPLSAEERGKIIEKIYPYYGASGIIDYVDNFIFDEDLILVAEDGANLLSRSTPLAFIATGKYWVNNHAHILKPLSHIIKFWQYLLQIYDFLPLISGSAQPKLTKDNLASILLPTPPVEEQTAIAHYLDTKLGEIDALIDKQQTLLEKLAEQRTAVITQAVTKGLNPAAPMKKSGVEWLGDVPAHWDIKHSNQIFKIHNGATPKTSEPDYWGDEIVWFTPKDLGDNQNKEISTSLKMITKEGYENCGVSLAPAKSIALSKRAPIGHLAITLLPAVVNQGCFLLEVLAPNDVNYLYYWLYANKTTLNSFGQGSTFMELPREKFAMLKISIPPKNEQTSIADYLDQETAKIDRLCETVNQTIGRLKEYRTALITQAVTGKIKVTDE